MTILGLAVSGKICSGKGRFLDIFRELVGSDKVCNLAFADKLKLFAKYLLVQISRTNIEEASRKTSLLIQQQLFNNEIEFDVIYKNIHELASASHSLEYAKPGISLFGSDDFPERDFDFGDIDKILWEDCGKPRKMLQELGTECIRSIRDSAWIDYAFAVAAKHPERFFCISDARFPNEVEHCRKNGFTDLRIEATEEVRLLRGKNRDGQDYSKMLTHPSETALDNFSFTLTINNNRTIDEFGKNISESLGDLISSLKEKFSTT